MPNLFKDAARRLLDRSLVPLLRYLSHHVETTTPVTLAQRRAVESSVEYAEAKMANALMFKRRIELWDYALSRVCVTGTCAEFGVFQGNSINYFAQKLPTLYGFDSFEGLKEDWTGYSLPKGHFSLKGKLPKVRKNVHLIKGWFDATIPTFLAQHPEPFAFVHIDCDTFEGAEAALNLIGPRLVPGTVILFDEYFGYRGWQVGEFKAWGEYTQRTGTEYKYLGFSTYQVALQLGPRS
jgi:predicted O-methyltransferase YrrM